jgi:integrase
MKKASISGFKAKYLFIRNDTFPYRRGISKLMHNLAGRSEFKESLRTDDPSVAIIRYAEVHSKYEAIFDQMRNGIPYNSKTSLPVEKLKPLASALGVEYLSAQEMIKRDDPAELVERYSQWDKLGRPGGNTFNAIFGAQPDPIKLSDALSFYEEHIRDELMGLSHRAKSKKLNPKRSSIRNFIDFLGADMDIGDIDRTTVLAYRAHLLDRIDAKQIIGGTANKLLGNIRFILNTNIKQRNLQITNPFSEIRVKEVKSSRPPFSVEYLRKNWFADGIFSELNIECRSLLFAMIDTGCGHNELCGLDPDEDIKLDHEIPHIIVRPNQHRKLKTDHRGREIPLVGHALTAFNQCPEGFPRYRRSNGSEAASGLMMKFLRNNDLLESPNHSAYSLRHTFKDRMRVHKFPPDLQNYLMGHKDASMGAHYGSGYSLKEKSRYMNKMTWDWK